MQKYNLTHICAIRFIRAEQEKQPVEGARGRGKERCRATDTQMNIYDCGKWNMCKRLCSRERERERTGERKGKREEKRSSMRVREKERVCVCVCVFVDVTI